MLISNSIGDILKETRERSNLSQQELANMAYLSRQTISKYELDVSQISVEKFMMLLDIMGASVLLKDGKITIMEVKNMKTFGYLRINAMTAKAISSDMERVSVVFKNNGVELVNIFELTEYIKADIKEGATLDTGLYITVDFKNANIEQKYIENPYCDGLDSSPVWDLLKNIESCLSMEDVSFITYHPVSRYTNLNPETITFKDIDLVKSKLKSLYESFNPKGYDVIFPNQGAGYLKVKKDGKYGFIDYRTGEEKIPCKFDYIGYFDYFYRNKLGEMSSLARYNGEWVMVTIDGDIYLKLKPDNKWMEVDMKCGTY